MIIQTRNAGVIGPVLLFRVRRVFLVFRKSKDLGHFASVPHSRESHLFENAVICGGLVVVNQKVGDTLGGLGIKLREDSLEWTPLLSSGFLIARICEGFRIRQADMDQVMIYCIIFGSIDDFPGLQAGEVHGFVLWCGCEFVFAVLERSKAWLAFFKSRRGEAESHREKYKRRAKPLLELKECMSAVVKVADGAGHRKNFKDYRRDECLKNSVYVRSKTVGNYMI